MDESKIIESYNEGVTEIISMMKELNMELISQVNNLNQEIKALREENLKLIARNAELEAKSKKNSKNSSKPPSSDNHKRPSNSRKKTDRSTGGQKGHEGKTLSKVENPDNIVEIKAKACECGCSISNVEGKMLLLASTFDEILANYFDEFFPVIFSPNIDCLCSSL